MDPIQKRTLLALGGAILFHVVLFVIFYSIPKQVEVSLTAENISTQIGFAQPKAAAPKSAQVKPQAKPPKETPKPKQIKKKPVKKKVVTAKKNPKQSVPLQEKVQPQPKPKPQSKSKPANTESRASSSNPGKSSQQPPSKIAGGAPKKKKNQGDINQYIRRVAALIDRKKTYPRLSRSNKEEGVVGIRLVIGRSGNLISYSLSNQTSFARLKQATDTAVRKAAPFPPLPKSFSGSSLSFSMSIRYRLGR